MSGLPLLLLCGIGSDGDGWRDQVRDLDATAIVAQGDTIDAMADHLLAQAPPRFALAGHSMGGYVAIAAALRAPGRVDRLALFNSSAASDTPDQAENRRRTIALIEARGLDPLVRALPPMLSADPLLQARSAAMLLEAGVDRVLREYRACAIRPDRREALATITLPVLVVGTLDDRIVPPAAAQEMATLLPDATLELFPDGGHISPMAHPGRVTALLRDWLARPV